MKTLTITLHDTDNCGSSLQSFALQHFLILNEIDNEIIDYVPSYVKNNGSCLKTLIRKTIFFKDSIIRDIKFKKFKKKYLIVTKRKYKTYNQLNREKFDCDYLITGSDQLWNSTYKCGNDPAYYLNFSNSTKKIAYAVSVGKEKIDEKNMNIIQKNVNNFKWISVREGSSVKQLKQVINNINVEHVCDPVLLNDINEYNLIKNKRIIKGNYILVYMAQIPDSNFMNCIIEKLRKKYKAKVVLIGSYRNRCYSDIHIRDVAPGDFLSLIDNAEYIVSNSFHATMFSLMYEKQFCSILPENNGARIKEILDKVGLKENYINLDDKEIKIPFINSYEDVRKKLNVFRKDSKEKLLNNLRDD